MIGRTSQRSSSLQIHLEKTSLLITRKSWMTSTTKSSATSWPTQPSSDAPLINLLNLMCKEENLAITLKYITWGAAAIWQTQSTTRWVRITSSLLTRSESCPITTSLWSTLIWSKSTTSMSTMARQSLLAWLKITSSKSIASSKIILEAIASIWTKSLAPQLKTQPTPLSYSTHKCKHHSTKMLLQNRPRMVATAKPLQIII